MSMQLNFEPHSWYMDAAIQFEKQPGSTFWTGYIENGNTYRIDELRSDTLNGLKQAIQEYHLSRFDGYGERIAKRKLEYLRGELRAERISYRELADLFKYHEYIDSEDVELLEAAGVPEAMRS